MNKAKLSIIIVGLNVKEWLIPCLRSIFKNPPSFNFEVIYVDNGSSDETCLEVRSLFPKVKIIQSKSNLGFTKANNLGFQYSNGEYLLFLNSDTEIVGQALSKMVNYLEVHKKIGVLGPKLYQNREHKLQISSTGELTPLAAIFAFTFLNKWFPNNQFSKKYFLSDWDRDSERQVAAVSGAALMIRKEIFEKIEGFDERFFIYFEESDLCRSVRKIGCQVVYYPKAEVVHFGGKTTSKISWQMKSVFLLSRFKYFEKHFGLPVAILTETILRFFELITKIK